MKRIIFFLFLFSPFISFPQEYIILSKNEFESLVKSLPGSEVNKRIDILNSLASFLAPIDFDSSAKFSVEAMRLSTQYGNQKGIGLARYNLGNAYYFKLDFKNALISYLEAQTLFEKGPYYNELGDLSLKLGNINFFIQRAEKAISFYRKALGYYQEAGNKKSLPTVYDALSQTIFLLNTTEPIDSALIYGYKMLNHSRQNRDTYLEAYALMSIAMFYSVDRSSLHSKKKTLVYCDSAMVLSKTLKDDGLVSLINITLGNYYDKITPYFELSGNLALSRTYYQKAYESSIRIGCSYLQAASLRNLAYIDLQEGKQDNANKHLDLCQTRLNDFFAFEWKNTPARGYIVNSMGKIMDYFIAQRERRNMYYLRYKLSLETKEYNKAIESLQSYYQVRDTMYAMQKGQQFELLMTENEADKQSQKIRTLEQDNELNQLKLSRTRIIFIGIGSGILLFSLIFLMLFQRRKLKAEQKSVMNEQRLLRTQMNPHFIFNSLASIQNFVINENADQASIYLSRFSQLVRNILDSSIEEHVSLEKDISTIENYLELQKIRYAGKFDYKIILDEKIDSENMQIPPMLSQPFIENAIEHGIRHKLTQGQIDIRFNLKDSLIQVEVEDDGVGRELAKEIESKYNLTHRSMAISITKDRLELLNKKHKKKISMEIIDLKDDAGKACGTKVVFGIPLVEK